MEIIIGITLIVAAWCLIPRRKITTQGVLPQASEMMSGSRVSINFKYGDLYFSYHKYSEEMNWNVKVYAAEGEGYIIAQAAPYTRKYDFNEIFAWSLRRIK